MGRSCGSVGRAVAYDIRGPQFESSHRQYSLLTVENTKLKKKRPSLKPITSVARKKLPNVYKSCPKMISLEKLKILTPLQKLPKTVRDLGKLIVAKGFKKLPKVQ